MRIWIANHYAVPPKVGGITRHFELANEWLKQDDISQVIIWSSSFIHSKRAFITPSQRKETESSVLFKWIWSLPHRNNDWKRILNMISFAVLYFIKGIFARKPDIIIGSSPDLLTAFISWVLSLIKRSVFVLEVRDLWPDSLIIMGGLSNKFVVQTLYWMEKWLYKRADRIVVLTKHQRKHIMQTGVCSKKIEFIPNGVDSSSAHVNKELRQEYRAKMGVKDNDFVAIYTGAHGPANQLDTLLRAAKLSQPGIFFVLIGDGPEKQKLQEQKQRDHINNVIFLPPVAKNDIFNYTYAADAGVISLADNEVFRGARPNKLFDYMFIGLPIISTIGGEVREVIDENRVGFYAGCPSELAKILEKVKNFGEDQLSSIRTNGQNFIRTEGDREKLAQRFYLLLTDLNNK